MTAVAPDPTALTADLSTFHESVGAVPIVRDVVTADGPEAASYLQGQLSQDVESLAVGASARAFVLQPQGKVAAWLRVTRLAADRFLLDTDPGWGDVLLARLQRFKLRTKVDLEAATWQAIALRGPGAPALAGPLDLAALGAVAVAPAGWPGVDGVDLLGPSVTAPPGVTRCTDEALDALRVAAGVPVMGAEATDATIPAELGGWVIDTSVSFTKGCYTGQELVARIDSRGSQVPRPVRGLLVDGDVVPPVGALLHPTAGDTSPGPGAGDDDPAPVRELGHVTSSSAYPTSVAPAWSEGAGAEVIALAVVARSVAPGDTVRVVWPGGEVTARVAVAPLSR